MGGGIQRSRGQKDMILCVIILCPLFSSSKIYISSPKLLDLAGSCYNLYWVKHNFASSNKSTRQNKLIDSEYIKKDYLTKAK